MAVSSTGTYQKLARLLPPPAGVLCMRALNGGLRKLRRHHVKETKYGFRLHCDLRDLIQTMIFHFGHWEPDVSAVIERFLVEGDTFVDVGANIGYDSLLASKLVGRLGKVVAVEASPTTFRVLQRNLALNDAANVRAVNLAASDTAGRTALYQVSETNTGAASIVNQGGTRAEEIEMAPLDQILSAQERASVKLIKIDVEGAEVPVVRRLITMLEQFPNLSGLIVELSGREHRAEEELFAGLRSSGFSAYKISNEYSYDWYLHWREPKPLEPLLNAPSHQTDILFCRSGALPSSLPRQAAG